MRSSPGGRWLLRALGPGLFVWILLTIDAGAALALLARADAAIFLAGSLLIFPMIWLKNERWRLLLRRLGLKDPPRKTFLAYLAGLYLGLLTPGRVGDLFRARLLGPERGARARAVAAVLWDRVFDVFALLLLGTVALGPVRERFDPVFRASLVLTVCAAVGLAFVRLLAPRLHGAGSGFSRLVPDRFRGAFRSGWSALIDGCRLLSLRDFLLAMLLSVAAWGVYVFQAFAGSVSLSLGIQGFPLAVSAVFSAVAGLLPVSISGIGTRDGALVYAFRSFGRGDEEAVAFSLVILLFLAANAVFGALALWRLGAGGGENGVDAGGANWYTGAQQEIPRGRKEQDSDSRGGGEEGSLVGRVDPRRRSS
jgi:uncharacterized protein (TIRG00374 family)